MKEISLLIGSGFSTPAGISSTEEINRIVSNLKKEQFFYSQEKTAGFLFGEAYANKEYEHVEEKKFVEEFLNFYNREISGNKSVFDYEKFYDFFLDVYEKNSISSKLEAFLKNFKDRNSADSERSHESYLDEFNTVFPQIIKSMVWKDFSKLRLSPTPSGFYPANSDYGVFLNLIIHLTGKYLMNIHSLNHDLLLESFNETSAFNRMIDDGFTTGGSPVYGELAIPNSNLTPGTYLVRLPVFTDHYSSKIRLYKLQGSIDRYRFYNRDTQRIIKVLRWIKPSGIFLEENNDNGPVYTAADNENIRKIPDFFTGSQTRRKLKDSFYSAMYSHFEENLSNSNTLIVIGYGFGDRTVNDYLEEFAQNVDNMIIIIDRKSPSIPFNMLCPNEFLGGGVSGFDLKKLLSLVENS